MAKFTEEEILALKAVVYAEALRFCAQLTPHEDKLCGVVFIETLSAIEQIRS